MMWQPFEELRDATRRCCDRYFGGPDTVKVRLPEESALLATTVTI
jgi:hypothetical protein